MGAADVIRRLHYMEVIPMGILNRLMIPMALINRVIKGVKEFKTERRPVLKTQSDPKVYGTHGRLEIPDLLIGVPLYDAKGSESQAVVDKVNSAVYMHWPKQDAIADHASQANFSNLNMAKVDRTVAIIDYGNREEKYHCVNSQVGHIRISPSGNRIFDENWNMAYFQNDGGLCIYTCMKKSADDVMDVRLTYWQPIIE